MSKTTAGMEDIYFEMESKQVTDAGTYDKLAVESVISWNNTVNPWNAGGWED